MDSRELRKGNLVHGIQTGNNGLRLPATLVDFVIHTIEVGECEVYVKGTNPAQQRDLPRFKHYDMTPIKITEERLIDFGFKKDIGKNNLPIMRLGGLYVYLDDFTITYMGNILAGEGYVHQLQNIYFALTGEELTIKQD